MAVKLEKIYQDCAHPDPQIQTFALMSITRLSPQLVDAPGQIQRIVVRLKSLVNSPNPDVVFLARKAVNHLEAHFKAFMGASQVPVPPPPQARSAVRPPEGLAPLETASHPGPAAPVETVERAPAVPFAPPVGPEGPPGLRPAEPGRISTQGLPSLDPARPSDSPAAAVAPEPPAPQRPARDLTREEILALLPLTTDTIYLASLLIALVQKGTPADVDAVLPFLRHQDDRVRANAVEAVQAHGREDHIGHLVPLLEDRSNRVVGNACTALARFDHPAVAQRLASMLRTNLISMRETAAYVLSTLAKDYVEPLLIAAAQDPYEGVRLRAVKSLARFVTRDSVNALKNALNDMDIDICEAASDSLKQIKAALQARRAQEGVAAQAAAAQAKPPTPAPPQPAAPEASPAASERDGALREFGMVCYQLCRSNTITNELLDGIFYEVLRYQDFLRAYQAKLAQGGDDQVRAAVAKLEDKIRSSLVNLGRQAASLFESKQISLPEKERATIMGHLDKLKKIRRQTVP